MHQAALVPLSILFYIVVIKADFSPMTTFPSSLDVIQTIPEDFISENTESTQTPKRLLIEFLMQLRQQTNVYNNREENETQSNLTTDATRPVKPPQATTIPTVAPTIENSSTTSSSITTCDYISGRNDCGYPGITPEECRRKGCCWDHLVNDHYWCFHPRKVTAFPTETVPTFSPLHRIGKIESTIEPTEDTSSSTAPSDHLNSTQLNLNATASLNQFTTSHSTLSPDAQEFLSSIQDELRGLEESASTETTTIASSLQTTFSNLPQTEQRILLSTIATQQATTTDPANMPFHDRYAQMQQNQSQGTPQSNWSYLSNLQELAFLLKFVEELERIRSRPSVIPKQENTCELSNDDSCCRIDPNSPCCAFAHQTPPPHRAAPVARIVGGLPAGSLRHSVAHLSKGPLRQHFCGGTLINDEWVLTAAHCVLEFCYNLRSASDIMVSLGKYHKSPLIRDRGQQDITARNVICHPNQCRSSDSKPRINDVALIRLSKPAIINQYVSPALMPEFQEQPSLASNCIVMGWGRTRGSGFTHVLKQVSVPLQSNQKCNLPSWRNCIVKACMLCAGDINIDPCDGDSGGPLFCPRPNGVYVLHGVYSWGRCGVDRKKPSIYMRSSPYIDWISQIVQSFPPRNR